MNDIIKLYEEYNKGLIEQRKELMGCIRDLSEVETDDKEIREFVNEMLHMSSYIGDCISISERKIKRLKRELERA